MADNHREQFNVIVQDINELIGLKKIAVEEEDFDSALI